MISGATRARAPPIGIVTFALAVQRYGILASEVVEVQRAVAMARLPRSPAIVEGVIDLRGTLAPVLDLRSRFGLPPAPLLPSDHLVIARVPRTASGTGPPPGSRVVAIRVDRVLDLVQVAPEQIEDARRAVPASAYLAGVAKLPDGLVLIHDLRTFLSLDEGRELDDALTGAGAS